MRYVLGALLVVALVSLPVFADEGGIHTARQLDDEAKYAEAAEAYKGLLQTADCPYEVHVRYQTAALRGGTTLDDLVAWYDELAGTSESVAAKLHRLRLDPAADRRKALTEIQKANPDAVDARLELGRMQLEMGDAKKAVSTLKKAVSDAPERTDIALLLIEARFQMGKTKDARNALQALLANHKDLREGWFALARVELADDDFEAAVAAANKAIAIRPSYIAALLVRAEAERALDKVDAAIATLTTANRVNAEDLAVQIALADAVSAQETEAGYGRAATIYQQVLEKDPENLAAVHGLGWVREREEKYEEALALYEQFVSARPDDPMGHNSVGVVLFKMGNVSKAQSKFKLASDKDKTFAEALANLGMTYDAQAKYTQAIKVYEKVLRMKGQKENLRVLISCAFDHESVGALSKATKLLEQAHEIKPEDADICVWLGDNQFFQKKWKTAEKWYKLGINIDAENFYGWRGLGYTLVQRRKFEDAVAAFEKARRLESEDADVCMALGDLYLNEIEDLEKALAAYKEYVDRGGDDESIPDLIEEIESRLN